MWGRRRVVKVANDACLSWCMRAVCAAHALLGVPAEVSSRRCTCLCNATGRDGTAVLGLREESTLHASAACPHASTCTRVQRTGHTCVCNMCKAALMLCSDGVCCRSCNGCCVQLLQQAVAEITCVRKLCQSRPSSACRVRLQPLWPWAPNVLTRLRAHGSSGKLQHYGHTDSKWRVYGACKRALRRHHHAFRVGHATSLLPRHPRAAPGHHRRHRSKSAACSPRPAWQQTRERR